MSKKIGQESKKKIWEILGKFKKIEKKENIKKYGKKDKGTKIK